MQREYRIKDISRIKYIFIWNHPAERKSSGQRWKVAKMKQRSNSKPRRLDSKRILSFFTPVAIWSMSGRNEWALFLPRGQIDTFSDTITDERERMETQRELFYMQRGRLWSEKKGKRICDVKESDLWRKFLIVRISSNLTKNWLQ